MQDAAHKRVKMLARPACSLLLARVSGRNVPPFACNAFAGATITTRRYISVKLDEFKLKLCTWCLGCGGQTGAGHSLSVLHGKHCATNTNSISRKDTQDVVPDVLLALDAPSQGFSCVSSLWCPQGKNVPGTIRANTLFADRQLPPFWHPILRSLTCFFSDKT